MSRYVTKEGRDGTLYRYEVRYDDGPESGFPPDVWRCWAYDHEHALEKWYGALDADGWRILSGPTRVAAEVRS